jgi:hypothetical protein
MIASIRKRLTDADLKQIVNQSAELRCVFCVACLPAMLSLSDFSNLSHFFFYCIYIYIYMSFRFVDRKRQSVKQDVSCLPTLTRDDIGTSLRDLSNRQCLSTTQPIRCRFRYSSTLR